MKILFILLILTIQPAFAQRLPNSSIGSSANFVAAKQYLAGKEEESLALYQKAILKAESDYGKNGRAVGTLNYQLGVRALSSSKFDLAEHSFKKAVEINPNCEAARLMLIQLLRFRNKDAESYYQTQQALKKHADSIALHRDLILCLQDKNPAYATQQAFIINCLQTDNLDKIPNRQRAIEKPVAQASSRAILTPAIDPNKQKHEAASTNQNAKKTANKSTKSINLSANQTGEHLSHKTSVNQNRKRKANSPSIGRLPAGLVPPPPPPAALGFPAPRSETNLTELKAKAAIIKTQKNNQSADKSEKKNAEEKAASSEPAPKHASEQAAGEDPDFLLDWAGSKKKRAK